MVPDRVVCAMQASKTQFVNKVQQCFAVRAQVDSFLDISRGTFTRLTGEEFVCCLHAACAACMPPLFVLHILWRGVQLSQS